MSDSPPRKVPKLSYEELERRIAENKARIAESKARIAESKARIAEQLAEHQAQLISQRAQQLAEQAERFAQERAESEAQAQQIAEKDELISQRAQQIAEKDELISQRAQQLEASRNKILGESLLSVLPGQDFLQIPSLMCKCEETATSHMTPTHVRATITQANFAVPNLVEVNTRLKLDLESEISSLRLTVNDKTESAADGVLTYKNEYDVQEHMQHALRDAVRICNKMIKKISGNSKPTVALSVHRETNIFSNIVDHMTVCDTMSWTPLFCVATKTPWGGVNFENVYGQVFDLLASMHAKGHPNPFGAFSSFDKTYILCLDNCASQNVLASLESELYGQDRLERIVGNLPAVADGKSCMTQSSVKDRNGPAAVATGRHRFKEATRRLKCSCEMHPNGMVSAFVSAILCSLDGWQLPRDIIKFEMGEKVDVQALSMDKTRYKWGELEATYKGPLKTTCNTTWKIWKNKPTTYYLVDYLGEGATSKAYRALTEDGYDCVVKMYVKLRGDDKFVLEKKEFDRNGKAAVSKEVQEYKVLYGDYLKGFVWKETLNGLQCVIRPYFKRIETDQRKNPEILEEIREILHMFAKCNLQFPPDDEMWRHIGTFQDKLYLFDIADLLADDD
jgi:hypothetical protein